MVEREREWAAAKAAIFSLCFLAMRVNAGAQRQTEKWICDGRLVQLNSLGSLYVMNTASRPRATTVAR